MNEAVESKDRQNLLLFLGAGFSCEAGLPLQNNFFEFVRQTGIRSNLDSYEYAGITAAQMIALVSNTDNEEPNMETAFSMLDYIYYMKNDDYKLAHLWQDDFIPPNDSQLGVEKLREQFLKALEKIFECNRPNNTYINHELYYAFFDELLKIYNVYIITTNYDLVCESVFKKMKNVDAILFPVITYGEWTTQYFPVPLLKLHGSINWKETKYDLPNIIPPTWSKHFERKGKYNRIWNEAEKAITISDKIVFIGYSMPETDTHIQFLIKMGLLNSLTHNKSKDVIVVKPNWKEKDNVNFGFLKDKISTEIHNKYHIKSFKHIPKKFRDFVNSDFINLLKSS